MDTRRDFVNFRVRPCSSGRTSLTLSRMPARVRAIVFVRMDVCVFLSMCLSEFVCALCLCVCMYVCMQVLACVCVYV